MRQIPTTAGAARHEFIPDMRVKIATHLLHPHAGSRLTLQPHRPIHCSPSHHYASTTAAVSPTWSALLVVLAPAKCLKMQFQSSLFCKGIRPHPTALKNSSPLLRCSVTTVYTLVNFTHPSDSEFPKNRMSSS